MSDQDLNTEIKISANADGVESGVTRAKRSLATLGQAADQVGEQGAKGFGRLGAGSEDAGRRMDQTTKNMVSGLQRQIAALEAGGTATRQYQESIARLRGADLTALRPYLDQLDAAKAKAEGATRAQQGMEGSMGTLGNTAGFLRGQMVALVGSFTFAAGLAFVRQMADAVDALNDVKDATGASIENISALEDVAQRTGTTLDVVTNSMVKLNDVLNKAKPGSDQALALKAIGLEAEALKKLDPAEALRQVAVALSGYADDQNKARLVQELFGKSLREMAPFLADLAEKTELVGKVTAAQAAEAEKFNKQLFALQTSASDAGRALVSGMLPGLNQISEAMGRGAKEGGLLLGIYRGLAEFAGMALGTDKLGQQLSAAKDAQAEMVRLSNVMIGVQATLEREPDNAGAQRRLDTLRAKIEALQKQALAATDAIKGMVGPAPAGASDEPAKPSVVAPISAAENNAAAAAAKKAAEEQRRELQEQAKLFAELSGLSANYYEELAKAQKMRASGNFTDAQYVAFVEALIAKQPFAIAMAKEETEATKARVRAYQESAKAEEAALATRQRSAATGQQQVQRLRDEEQAAMMAASGSISLAQAVEQIALARLRDEEAKLRSQGADGATLLALQQEIEAREQIIDLIGSKAVRESNANAARKIADESARMADDINRSLTDALLRGFESGKGFAENFRATLSNMFNTLVLRPIISAVVSPVAGLITGGLGLSGGASASTGGGILSTASSGLSLATGAFGQGFRAGISGLLGEAGLGGTISAGTTAIGAGNIAGGLGTLAGPLALVGGGLMLLNSLLKSTKGETRTGGQFGVSFDGTVTNNRRGETYTYQGQQFDRDFSNGQRNALIAGQAYRLEGDPVAQESAIRDAVSGTAKGIDAFLEALGSAARLTGFSAGLETSGKGRGGVFAGGTLSDGTAFGESGKGDNYEGTLFEKFSTNSPDFKTALENFTLDLKQSTIQALQSVTDIPKSVQAMLRDVDAEGLSEEAANALLESINAQIVGVEMLKNSFEAMGLEELAMLSFDAAAGLAAASGGFDKLQSNLSSFYDNYSTDDDKRANLQKQLDKEFASLGIDVPKTRDEYKRLVEEALGQVEIQQAAKDKLSATISNGIKGSFTIEDLGKTGLLDGIDPALYGGGAADPATASKLEGFLTGLNDLAGEGLDPAAFDQGLADLVAMNSEVLGIGKDASTTAAVLLRLNGVFAELNESAEEAAARIERERAKAQDEAYSNFRRAVERDRNLLNDQASGLQDIIGGIADAVSMLDGNARDLYASVASTSQMMAVQGMLYVEQALAGVRAGASVADFPGLSDAIDAARGGIDGGVYVSDFDRRRDALVLAGQVSDLRDDGKLELSVAERQLKGITDQIEALNLLADKAEAQVNGLTTLNETVDTYFARLMALLAPPDSGNTKPELVGGGGGGFVVGGGNAGGGGGGAAAKPTYGTLDPTRAVFVDSFINSLEWQGGDKDAESTAALADYARANNISQADLADRLGFTPEQIAEHFDRYGIPSFDVGTNYVPRDMLARIHEGEAILPKAFNPWADGQGMGGAAQGELVAAMGRMETRMAMVETHTANTAANTSVLPSYVDQRDDVSAGGNADRVEIMNVDELAGAIAQKLETA